MKVIFLDFDGVLNSNAYLMRSGGQGVTIDPARMVLLKQIVDATGAKIVLSSSWRLHWSAVPEECNFTGRQIEEIFAAHEMKIWDKTPTVGRRREGQIKQFLDDHPEIENFVVLDDMLLYADYLEGHMVKTAAYFEGLDAADVGKAIEILTRHES
ncbi:MAG: hypothetical protein IKU07_09720 [Oscillospiraceae bacterium]|nr:hypothetical protein [Oscillospiraceae bacterium]